MIIPTENTNMKTSILTNNEQVQLLADLLQGASLFETITTILSQLSLKVNMISAFDTYCGDRKQFHSLKTLCKWLEKNCDMVQLNADNEHLWNITTKTHQIYIITL